MIKGINNRARRIRDSQDNTFEQHLVPQGKQEEQAVVGYFHAWHMKWRILAVERRNQLLWHRNTRQIRDRIFQLAERMVGLMIRKLELLDLGKTQFRRIFVGMFVNKTHPRKCPDPEHAYHDRNVVARIIMQQRKQFAFKPRKIHVF